MSTEILYNITDFTSVKNDGFVFNLEQSVLDIIQNISNQVGAPEYIRTPQFSKQKYDKRNNNNADWEDVRNFKATTFEEKTGVKLHIDNIRKHVNKITAKTYDSISVKIIEELTSITESEVSGETEETDVSNDKLYAEIGDSIFTIASTNMFYSHIYARLYKDLMDKFSFMKEIFDNNFTKCSDVYRTIEYCSPNEDYDRYCEINKANEERRSISMFYINLMKLKVIPVSSIVEIILGVQDYLHTLYVDEANKAIVDELSEVIFILVTNAHDELSSSNDWVTIHENILNITSLKVSDKEGLTNKSIFKHMDIVDDISKK
jgi:hypothetical protein|tara:strand:- start:10 stop:966 length:957 start_codon:yes stop_codon:yes gene_type:complete